jgi:transposase
MYHLFMYRRKEYMQHYHKRSNIETAYSMINGKFGSALRSKSDTGQINEALYKVFAHNVCVLVQAIHELGLDPVFFAPTRPQAADLDSS